MSNSSMFIVFDLDGTLCDITHRLHFIEDGRGDWDRFYAACIHDEPKLAVLSLLHALKGSGQIEIWTGRSDRTRHATNQWLEEQNIHPAMLTRMRRDGDRRPDHKLKRAWLHESIHVGRKPDIAFEDRQRVVDMWRDEEITCCQVAPGGF